MADLELRPEQVRVLGALVEKSVTTPNNYPMTVNAITTAANQKNARVPLMQLSEVDVQRTLTDLESMNLVDRDDTSRRASKWTHQFRSQMLLKTPAQAVLVTLMLRGPQTSAELLRNAQSLHGPTSSDALDAVLEDLSDRGRPLVQLLPRAPGQKESRWVHLLCGEPDPAHLAAAANPASSGGGGGSAQEERIAALEQRVATLESRIEELDALLR